MAVAEFVLGLIISLAKKITFADMYLKKREHIKTKTWADTTPLLGENLEGKVLGIIGLGRIGSELAKKCRCLGTKVVYFDNIRKPLLEEKFKVKYVSFDNVFTQADFISIHVPLTNKNRKMIGLREFNLMKPTAYFINTARGEIVDQHALYDVLKNRRIAGASLDVFELEPISPNEPLLELDNVILTPHIAAFTPESLRSTAIMVFKDVLKALEGERPDHIIYI